MIYAHHFAKGTGGDRSAIDRAAGAGAFARDPDAILTMTELSVQMDENAERSAWRMEYILREFPRHKPVSFWWEYPLHKIDSDLDDEEVETSVTRAAKAREKSFSAKLAEQKRQTRDVAEKIADRNGLFTLSQFVDEYSRYEDLPRTTARRRLENAGYIIAEKGVKGNPAKWRKE